MIWGIDLAFLGNDRVEFLIGEFFDNGVIVENAGRHGCVIKLIPPLNIDIDLLTEGLETITGIIASEVEKAALMSSAK